MTQETANPPLADIREVTVLLGTRRVVRDASLTIKRGEVVGLIGPNGAGKTSLLRAILRLLPLHTGSVRLRGTDVSAFPPHRLAELAAYLPQASPVHWPITVEALVTLARTPLQGPFSRLSAEDAEAVSDAIRECDLDGFRDRPVDELSGGERTRVLVARLMASRAPVLIADEPATALDPYHQLAVMEMLRGAARQGRGVLLTLHDLSLAARHCDRLILMNAGTVAATGAPATVLTPERIEAIYRVRMKFDPDGGFVPVGRIAPPDGAPEAR